MTRFEMKSVISFADSVNTWHRVESCYQKIDMTRRILLV